MSEVCNYWRRYTEYEYRDFLSYAELLEIRVKEMPDVVILAAAVSDYLTTPMTGKARSGGDMAIHLHPAPKLITKVKEWYPDCKLVGFKLLVDSTDEQLVMAARNSVEKNGCEFVVANDLRDIKAGEHRLLIVDKDGVEEFKTDPADPDFLAGVVAARALQ